MILLTTGSMLDGVQVCANESGKNENRIISTGTDRTHQKIYDANDVNLLDSNIMNKMFLEEILTRTLLQMLQSMW